MKIESKKSLSYHVQLSRAGPHIPPWHLEVVASVRVPLALERGVVVGLDTADPVGASLTDGHDDAARINISHNRSSKKTLQYSFGKIFLKSNKY